MAEQANLRPRHLEKNLGAMNAERTAKRITFERTKANPGVLVLKHSERVVIAPGSMGLLFGISVSIET